MTSEATPTRAAPHVVCYSADGADYQERYALLYIARARARELQRVGKAENVRVVQGATRS